MSTSKVKVAWPVETQRRRRGHGFYPTQAELAGIPRVAQALAVPEGDREVRVHWFVGGMDWWLVGFDPDTLEGLAYVERRFPGPATPAAGAWNEELDLPLLERATVGGSVSLSGRERRFEAPVERDLHWSRRPFGEVAPASWQIPF